MLRSKALTHASVFRRRLLAWFRRHGRDLPWRRTRDPYHVVVSEFMLQQTQVSRVVGYYGRFLQRYPTLESLASASPRTVRESWEGLGYYRRATNLHRLARTVVRELGGRIPSEPAELRRLPGVGRYTAGAVATFAFERSTAAVDTNVARVLQRVFHPRLQGPAAGRRLWSTAEQIVPRQGSAAWSFNQALMELGALVCTARDARCGICPVREVCRTGKSGRRPGGVTKRVYRLSIAPANRATRPKVPAIEATIRCRARSSSK
jgi:A/G-specific adenine glycosylase